MVYGGDWIRPTGKLIIFDALNATQESAQVHERGFERISQVGYLRRVLTQV